MRRVVNKVRSFAFSNAYFTRKVSVRGSKGDFIFREYDENRWKSFPCLRYRTERRNKNSDFYKGIGPSGKELWICRFGDYAWGGWRLLQHGYRVPTNMKDLVRPQFFIQLIGLLRNAALNSLKYKQELALVREQNIDITHFEADAFKVALPRFTTPLPNNFGKVSMKLIRPSNMWKRSRVLTTSERSSFASLITNWRMFQLRIDEKPWKQFEALKGEWS